MPRRAVAIAVLAAAACAGSGAPAGSRAPTSLAAAHPGGDPLAVPEPVRLALSAFSARLHREVPAACAGVAEVFAAEGPAFLSWCQRVAAARAVRVLIEQEPYAVYGDVVVLGFTLGAQVPAGPVIYAGGLAWARLAGSRVVAAGWIADLTPVVPARLAHERATVALHPDTGRLEGEALLRIQSAAAGLFAIRLRVGEETPSWGVTDVTQVGTPGAPGGDQACRFREVGRDLLFVVPARPASEIELRVRWGGLAPWTGPLDRVRGDEIILRPVAGWLPVLTKNAPTDFDLTVVHPAVYAMFGQGEAVDSRSLPDGRTATRFRHRGDDFTLYGGRGYVVHRFAADGTTVEIGLRPDERDRLPVLERDVRRALTALAPLGRYPAPRLRITLSDFGGGHAGYGARSNLTIGRQLGDARAIVHELAHGWFPGVVPVAGGHWPEGVAEYLESWTMADAELAGQRARWRAEWEAVPAERRLIALAPGGGAARGDRRALVYARPAFVLSSLEAQVGRAAVARALTALLAERAGKPSTWEDVFAAFARAIGPQAAAELRQQLADDAAPRHDTAAGLDRVAAPAAR